MIVCPSAAAAEIEAACTQITPEEVYAEERRIQHNIRLRALEIVALAHFFTRLVERVIDFLKINWRRDIERGLSGHTCIL